tara:strand:- start:458 stop:1288 length:831 start_codon:yes stop_codon:yes gene_type:complete
MSKEGEAEFLAGLGSQSPVEEGKVDIDPVEDDQVDLPELSEMEQKAYDQGWRPQEDFTGPEDHWKTAKEYVKDGEWLAKIKEANQRTERLEKDFNERLENTNKLNEARRKTELTDLKKQQRDAVEMADSDQYESAQAKIDALEAETVVTAPQDNQKNPDVAAWEAKNEWINNPNDEKSTVAIGIFNNFANQNKDKTAQDALDHLDARLKQLYPTSNPRREQPNTTENGNKAPQRKGKDITMSDLTQDEKNEYNLYGHTMFKSEKDFLKAVKDARVK